MKRSEINGLIRQAGACFSSHGWSLPPQPRWDLTDFGLGDYRRYGLVLVNLAEEPEYCEKLMYAQRGMTTPAHTHRKKKEDIICRWGLLKITCWNSPELVSDEVISLKVSGKMRELRAGEPVRLSAGERITLTPGIYHEFAPASDECIIGEVSTANDDVNDNFFINPDIGRFPGIEEDEPPLLHLISDCPE